MMDTTISDEAIEQIRQMQGEIGHLRKENTRLTEELLSVTADRQIANKEGWDTQQEVLRLREQLGRAKDALRSASDWIDENGILPSADDVLSEIEHALSDEKGN